MTPKETAHTTNIIRLIQEKQLIKKIKIQVFLAFFLS